MNGLEGGGLSPFREAAPSAPCADRLRGYIEENGYKYEPQAYIWVEMPDNKLVSCHWVNPINPEISFSESLMEAMQFPIDECPRKPDTVRVEGSYLVTQIRPTLVGIEIKDGRTPELDPIFFQVAKDFARQYRSVIVDGQKRKLKILK